MLRVQGLTGRQEDHRSEFVWPLYEEAYIAANHL